MTIEDIPEYESPLRRLMAEGNAFQYKPIESFTIAKTVERSYVVFEGDWGGQIYLACPVSLIKCMENRNTLGYM
jgi:hypothetical protein